MFASVSVFVQSAFVVNADLDGVALVKSLRAVFPSTRVLATSKDPAKRAELRRLGATATVPSAPATLAALVDGLLGR